MAGEICQNFWDKEVELKKNSIYLLDDDRSDRGFEFFVFIDPDDTYKRPPFLKVLYNIVCNVEEKKKEKEKEDSVESKCKADLKKWLGVNSDNYTNLTPFNWLKITIEGYPYRLFLIGDQREWEKLTLQPFLKNRICFINKDDFFTQIRNDPKFQGLRYWLFEKWVMRLGDNLNQKGELKLKINLESNRDEDFYRPSSLYNTHTKNESKGTDLVIAIDKSGFKNLILYRRHDLIYVYRENWTCNEDLYNEDNSGKYNINYIEAASGSLSYFSELQNPTEYGKLKLVENGLLRVLIIDERLQEWANELSTAPDTKYISNLYQMRLLIGFLEKVSSNGQKDNKQPYEAILDGNGQFILKGGMTTNHNLKCGFDRDLKIDSIDVLIIHQGILDKWCNEKKVDLNKVIFNWKDKIPFIIVTSGRGRPENIPHNVKFLPFSNIEMCIAGQYFEKLTLIKQIFCLKEDI